jgi:hypothetical protein
VHHADMHALRTNNAGGRATTRSKISNRSRMLPGVDGRSSAARRFRDICANYEAQFGGNISELERDLIRQAAGLTLRAEQLQGAIVRGEPVSNDELVRISSTAKRLLETIRAKADKRKPTGPDRLRFAAGQGGEFGQLHCKLGHAVQIEPGLRPGSPENGNISNICRRLSTISLPQRPVSEPGD